MSTARNRIALVGFIGLAVVPGQGCRRCLPLDFLARLHVVGADVMRGVEWQIPNHGRHLAPDEIAGRISEQVGAVSPA